MKSAHQNVRFHAGIVVLRSGGGAAGPVLFHAPGRCIPALYGNARQAAGEQSKVAAPASDQGAVGAMSTRTNEIGPPERVSPGTTSCRRFRHGPLDSPVAVTVRRWEDVSVASRG